MNQLKCYYCGKFIAHNDPDFIQENIYGHLGVDAMVSYHKKCQLYTRAFIKLKMEVERGKSNETAL